jgi:hypothetical protein
VLDPMHIDVPHEQRLILQAIALVGILGGTPEEVAAYLLTRGIDDLLRSGCVKLNEEGE